MASFPGQPGYYGTKGQNHWTILDFMRQETTRWQMHQLHHMQITAP